MDTITSTPAQAATAHPALAAHATIDDGVAARKYFAYHEAETAIAAAAYRQLEEEFTADPDGACLRYLGRTAAECGFMTDDRRDSKVTEEWVQAHEDETRDDDDTAPREVHAVHDTATLAESYDAAVVEFSDGTYAVYEISPEVTHVTYAATYEQANAAYEAALEALDDATGWVTGKQAITESIEKVLAEMYISEIDYAPSEHSGAYGWHLRNHEGTDEFVESDPTEPDTTFLDEAADFFLTSIVH